MADPTAQELEELAEAAKQAADQLRRIAQTTVQNQTNLNTAAVASNKQVTASQKQMNKAVTEGKNALNDFGRSMKRQVKKMYDGEKAGSQAANFLSNAGTAALAVGTAFMFMNPLVGAVSIALGGLLKVLGASSEAAQQLYDSFQEVSAIGGGASGSLEDLLKQANQLGFGLEELGQFAQTIRNNAGTLAMFAGSVEQGSRQFGNFVEILQYSDLGRQLRNVGISTEMINETAAGFVKLQSRLGLAQTMTQDQLTKGSFEYAEQLNLLSRLTGASVDEQMKAQQEALSQQRFRAAYEAAMMSDDAAERAKMTKAMQMFTYFTSIGAKETAQGIADAATGFEGATEASSRLLLTAGSIQPLLNDTQVSAVQASRSIVEGMADQANRFNTLAQAGQFDDAFIPFVEILDSLRRSGNLTDEAFQKVVAEQGIAMDTQGSVNNMTKATMGLQMAARNALQNLIAEGIEPATAGLAAFAEFAGSFGKGPGSASRSRAEIVQQQKDLGFFEKYGDADYNAARKSDQQQFSDQLKYNQLIAGELRSIQRQLNIQAGKGLFGFSPLNNAKMSFEDMEKARQSAIDKLIEYRRNLNQDTGRFTQDYINTIMGGTKKGFQYGGIVSGPDTGYQATLHGTEAVVPLGASKEIPVDVKSAEVQPSTEQMDMMQAQLTRLDEMVRLLGKNNSLTQGLGAALQ